MINDWPQIKARLDGYCVSVEVTPQHLPYPHPKEIRFAADIRAALERVEELEREAKAARSDCYSANEACKEFRERAEAAEAKLARCVEAGGHLRGFAAGTDLGRAYIEDWDAALAAAKGE